MHCGCVMLYTLECYRRLFLCKRITRRGGNVFAPTLYISTRLTISVSGAGDYMSIDIRYFWRQLATAMCHHATTAIPGLLFMVLPLGFCNIC